MLSRYMETALWADRPPPGFDPEVKALQPKLEAYPAENGASRGAVIVFPGGGYLRQAPHEGEPVVRWLNGIGVHAFVLHYRVAPYRHPWPLADAQRAIRFVRFHRSRWNVAQDRIGVLGFSAGSHLAASAGTLSHLAAYEPLDEIDATDPRPDFMVLCYPVITFGAYRHDGSMRALLGDSPDDGTRRMLSIENSVDSHSAPAFLWHTATDAGVPVENSLLMAEALSRNKVPFELHILPEGPHGVGLAPDRPALSVWTELCARWLMVRMLPR